MPPHHGTAAGRRRTTAGRPAAGFTLVEVLLSLGLGVMVCAAVVQLLLSDSRSAERLVQRLRADLELRRTLELLREDVLRASRVAQTAVSAPACGLSGRTLVLHLDGAPGPVTYSVGSAPSAIWRGKVLMRCGPAFGLDGQPNGGTAQNRVVLDALPADGLRVLGLAAGRLEVELQQELPMRQGTPMRLASRMLMAAP